MRTQADTFYDHGDRIRIKGSKIGMNSWKPGVKIRDMYTYGFKKHFDKTNPKFGHGFYSVTDQQTPFDKIPCSLPKSTATREKEHYFAKVAKNKAWVPGYKYNQIDDWSKLKLPAYGEYNKRTMPRQTYCQEMAKVEKKRGVPDPGKYDQPSLIGKEKKNGSGMVKSTEEKCCAFIEDARAASQRVPRPGHLPANSQILDYKAVDPKMKIALMKENKNKNDERMAKIEKRPKDAAPGDINDTEAWKKFNTRRNEFKISTFKREIFTDTYKKQREFVPGPGKHHVEMAKYNRLSTSPKSIRIGRH